MYNNLLSFLSKAKTILVLGKGKINMNIKKVENQYDLCVGVKQSIALLSRKDILVMNDFEGLFGLNDCISEIKFILCPAKIHVSHQPAENNDLLYGYLDKYNFKGEIVLYEIYTNPDRDPCLELVKMISSGDVIFHFINKCKNARKKHVDVYGIYTNLEDNNQVRYLIVNATISKEYIDYFFSYIKRIYANKKKVNMKCLYLCEEETTATNPKKMMVFRQDLLRKQYPNLRLRFT